jgi:peptide/nickel transport system permease protein
VSWGSILEEAFSSGAVSQGAWWYIIPPGLCVVLIVLSFNLMGRAIESILDPREA